MKITDTELDEIETVAYLVSEENYKGERIELVKKIRKQILDDREKAEQRDEILQDLVIRNHEIKQLKEELNQEKNNKVDFMNRYAKRGSEISNLKQKLLSKIDELTKETKQRGLIIGKKYEEIKQLRVDYKIIDGEALDYRKKWRELLPKHQNLKQKLEKIEALRDKKKEER